MEEITPAELRLLLIKFVENHPEAEKQVPRLILKHLGISTSCWRSSIIDTASSSDSDGDGDNESDLYSPLPL